MKNTEEQRQQFKVNLCLIAYIYTHNIILKRLLLPFGFVCEHYLSDNATKV